MRVSVLKALRHGDGAVSYRRSNCLLAYSLLVVALCCASLYVCRSVFAAQSSASKIRFASDIVPILRENCNVCHNAETKSGGLRTETYEDLMKGGKSGPAVIPGKSSVSRLV